MRKSIFVVLVLLGAGCATHPDQAQFMGMALESRVHAEREELNQAIEEDQREARKRFLAAWQELERGMTYGEVLGLLKRPDHNNRTVTAYGTREQWVYQHTTYYGGTSYRMGGEYYYPNATRYVYFEDGKVVAWQD